MIDLKNKPTTLFIAISILGVGMLMGVGYVVYVLVVSLFMLKDAGLGVIVGVPAVILYLAQIALYVVLGYFLLRSIYRWSTVAIIASTIICPLALAVAGASVANQFGYTINLSDPIGIGLLIFFLCTPLVMGIVAYNDIRYRLPKK